MSTHAVASWSQDLQVDQLVRRYTLNPVMVIIDVKPKQLGIPTEAYHAVEVSCTFDS